MLIVLRRLVVAVGRGILAFAVFSSAALFIVADGHAVLVGVATLALSAVVVGLGAGVEAARVARATALVAATQSVAIAAMQALAVEIAEKAAVAQQARDEVAAKNARFARSYESRATPAAAPVPHYAVRDVAAYAYVRRR